MEAVICFLCSNNTIKKDIAFYEIQSTVLPSSQKPLDAVLQHLANCIKYKLLFQQETYVCCTCFKELDDYDELMLNLLKSQRRLTGLLENALTKKEEDSSDVEADEPIMEIELQFDNDVNLDNAPKEEYIDVDDEVNDDDVVEEIYDGELSAEEDLKSSDYICLGDSDNNEERKKPKQECAVCGLIFKSKYLLQNHTSEVHNAKQFTCKICGVTRKDEEYLELHMNIHDGKTEKQCRYCPKEFSRAVNTLRHMRLHWDKKKFQCEKCGERFSADNMLYNHRMRHEAEENPVICSICNQSFRSRKTFKHHQLIHEVNRPRHQCHLCPKSFTERYTLKMHLKTHSAEDQIASVDETKPHKNTTLNIFVDESDDGSDSNCIICNLKFNSKKIYQRHLQEVHNVII